MPEPLIIEGVARYSSQCEGWAPDIVSIDYDFIDEIIGRHFKLPVDNDRKPEYKRGEPRRLRITIEEIEE